MFLDEIFERLKITEYGFVSANDAQELILESSSKLAPKIKINTIDEILPKAKCIIVYLLPYNHGILPENLSIYATGLDYHKVSGDINTQICTALNKIGEDAIAFADSGPLNERLLASKAGLGLIGKNHFLINKTYGSFTFISYIITTHFLEPTQFEDSASCLMCNKCIEACPGKALSETGFNENQCISYLTQKKGTLSDKEIKILKSTSSVWGCDICQRICPLNNKVKLTHLSQFNENLILCIKNEYLSNRAFAKKYKDRAFSWRGKAVIDRNLSILNEKL